MKGVGEVVLGIVTARLGDCDRRARMVQVLAIRHQLEDDYH